MKIRGQICLHNNDIKKIRSIFYQDIAFSMKVLIFFNLIFDLCFMRGLSRTF